MLADELWKIWQRLGPAWLEYFKLARLDLESVSEDNFPVRLQQEIEVNYELGGLEEFSRLGTRGIEPGDPARSLFYHVLASPHVLPYGIADEDYATMADLETIENYIYSVSKQSLQSLSARAKGANLAIVIFAYEYAPAADTVHGFHADLIFSRTGISRVGNHGPHYVPKARGFFPDSGNNKVHVVPARFGAFLAMQQYGNRDTIGPLHFLLGDRKRKFWIPLHKLFNGTECLDELDLDLTFETNHINQKIRKIHLALRGAGFKTGWKLKDLQQHPFIISEGLTENFDATRGLIVPVFHDPLVEPARTRNGQLVGFQVPPGFLNLWGSLWFTDIHNARRSPEFVHAKHALVPDGVSGKRVVYLPDDPTCDIECVVAAGDYEAANFVDWTADGWLKVSCAALESVKQSLPGFSVVAQPDFFPLVKQQHLMDWWTGSDKDIKNRTWPDQGISAAALCSARLPANPDLKGADFSLTDTTVTAIIGINRDCLSKGTRSNVTPRRETTLSYKATNLFEPGWDSAEDYSFDRTAYKGVFHLANYGLGSPFPEDTLICAASGGFWPGAVPDTTRFFAPAYYPSTTPILDSHAAWDGTPLPTRQGNTAQYEAFAYADYVKTIYDGKFRYEEFVNVTFEDYKARTSATARVYQYLGVLKPKQRMSYAFLSFRNPDDAEIGILRQAGWPTAACRTFRVEVARCEAKQAADPKGARKKSVLLGKSQVFFAAETVLAYEDPSGSGKWNVHVF